MFLRRNNQTIDSGYTSPCLILNEDLLVFMLCLIYRIHQTIYHVALCTCYLHCFTVPLLSPFLCFSPQELQQRFRKEVRKRHRKSSAIVIAHSLAMQPSFVLTTAFLSMAQILDILLKTSHQQHQCIASFHHAHLLGQLCPGDQQWAADIQRWKTIFRAFLQQVSTGPEAVVVSLSPSCSPKC